MIVTNNGQLKGYTIFFPGNRSNGKRFQARDLCSGLHYVVARVLFQITATCVFIIYRHNLAIVNMASIVVFLYIAMRIASTKHIYFNASTEHLSYALAPPSLWFDHVSLYVMLVSIVFISNNQGGWVGLLGDFGIFIEFALILIGIFPVFSYIMFVKSK